MCIGTCVSLSVAVSIERGEDLPFLTGCKYGDTLTIESQDSYGLSEVVVIKKTGNKFW